MKITKKTKTGELLPVLKADDLDTILCKVIASTKSRNVLNMKIGEYIIFTNYGLERELLSQKKALKFLSLLKSYREQLEGIANYIKSISPSESEDERRASVGVKFPTFEERMLLDVQKELHLTSMEQAEQVPLSTWLLLLKDKCANVNFQKNLNALYKNKKT